MAGDRNAWQLRGSPSQPVECGNKLSYNHSAMSRRFYLFIYGMGFQLLFFFDKLLQSWQFKKEKKNNQLCFFYKMSSAPENPVTVTDNLSDVLKRTVNVPSQNRKVMF